MRPDADTVMPRARLQARVAARVTEGNAQVPRVAHQGDLKPRLTESEVLFIGVEGPSQPDRKNASTPQW